MKREAAVIALLVVLALSVPVLILYNGLADRAEREWLERPYEGTLAEFQQEYIGLLNEAAEILLRHADWYGAILAEWEYEFLLDDDEWCLDRNCFSTECREPYTEAEWAVLQQAFGEQMCTSVRISWWHVLHLDFSVRTTQEGYVNLVYVPDESADSVDFAALLESKAYIGWEAEKNAYPNWYAFRRLESTVQ